MLIIKSSPAQERENAEAAFEALCEKYEKSMGLLTALALLNACRDQFLFTIEADGRIACRDPKTGIEGHWTAGDMH